MEIYSPDDSSDWLVRRSYVAGFFMRDRMAGGLSLSSIEVGVAWILQSLSFSVL
jgi:hypothetical protein